MRGTTLRERIEEKRRDIQCRYITAVWPLAQKRNAGRPESSTIGPYRCIRERLPKSVLQKHRRTDVRVAPKRSTRSDTSNREHASVGGWEQTIENRKSVRALRPNNTRYPSTARHKHKRARSKHQRALGLPCHSHISGCGKKTTLREKRREEKRRDTQVSVPVWPLAQKRNAGRPESTIDLHSI